MSSPTPRQTNEAVALGLFDSPAHARQAVDALAKLGISPTQVGLLVPGVASDTGSTEASGLLAAASGAGQLETALASLGVAQGEIRFYANEVTSGRVLVAVEPGQNADAVGDVIVRHGGYDVQSRGAELARVDDAGVPGGTGPRPIDITGRWEDVASRYEMLWQQHYGTTDATWEQMAPVYRHAWYVANAPERRGRPWSEVEASIRREWESTQAEPWDAVAGPIFDVWEDVAEDAATSAEGGADRRIPSRD